MQLATICIIDASGTFLTDYLTQELIEGDEQQLYNFIDEHKWEVVEDYEAKDVLEMITNLAYSQEAFLKANIGEVLKQCISLEQLNIISNAATADIWCDADKLNDKTAQLIADTKNTLDNVSSILHRIIAGDVQ